MIPNFRRIRNAKFHIVYTSNFGNHEFERFCIAALNISKWVTKNILFWPFTRMIRFNWFTYHEVEGLGVVQCISKFLPNGSWFATFRRGGGWTWNKETTFWVSHFASCISSTLFASPLNNDFWKQLSNCVIKNVFFKTSD